MAPKPAPKKWRRRVPIHAASRPDAGTTAATRPQIQVIAYGPGEIREAVLGTPEELRSWIGRYPVLWVNLDAPPVESTLARFGEVFGLHRLALEDVAHLCQRPKVDLYESHLFVVLWMLTSREELTREQLSLFLGDNFVLTFQPGAPGDCLDLVRRQLRENSSRLRQGGADQLAYALMDAVVDSYFPILDNLGARLDTLEDDVMDGGGPEVLARLHQIKYDLQLLRRAIWPCRDVLNTLLQLPEPLISRETLPYFRDAYDHAIRLIDLLESDREMASSLMDVYLSTLNLRLNQVMKFLTMISTLFIPLSFIASIYGMNFAYMPELGWRYGYFGALGLMGAVAMALLAYFWRAGWIGNAATQVRRSST